MPRYRPVVLAAACALALAAPASAAYAATAHHAAKPVLTIGKKGGPAVKKRAVLKSGLAKGTSATFALGSFSATCKSSTLQAKVTANPSSRGKATLSLTRATVSKCTLKGAPPGVSLTGVKVLSLPYDVTISPAKRFPVTIAGRSSAKPVSLRATIDASALGAGTLTCVYTAKKVSGHASNTGNKVSVAKQKFALDKAKSSSTECEVASSVTFSATYGPIRDTSAKHSPKVFFN
ncbi:MAG TPA: hypothetical protein VMA72_23820 [Streptosporangiaceae bacterium]|nr:hypothetical protein [Streptosporangiaceae bacterium]